MGRGHGGRLIMVGGNGGAGTGRLMGVPGFVLPGGRAGRSLMVAIQDPQGVVNCCTVFG